MGGEMVFLDFVSVRLNTYLSKCVFLMYYCVSRRCFNAIPGVLEDVLNKQTKNMHHLFYAFILTSFIHSIHLSISVLLCLFPAPFGPSRSFLVFVRCFSTFHCPPIACSFQSHPSIHRIYPPHLLVAYICHLC